MTIRSRLRGVAIGAGLVAASVSVCLLAAELLWRASADDVAVFRFRNYAEQKLSLFQSRYPSAYDPQLGWIADPGYSGLEDNIWRQPVSIDPRGFRFHGPEPEGELVIAAGDSFTFGDEVADHETYPAHLQKRLQRPVINAGVFGYGFDQTYLRARRLLTKYEARALVVQAVVDDLNRMQMSQRNGVGKPYYDLVDREVVLKNVPAPPYRPKISDVGFVRHVFGYSYLVDWSMRRLGYAEWWYVGNWPHAYAYRDYTKATDIACHLVKELGAQLESRQMQGVFISQYARHVIAEAPYDNPFTKPLRTLAGCAKAAGFEVVDTYPLLRPIADSDRARFDGYYRQVHFSSAGNRWLADRIAEALSRPGPG